jgi:hypothetical protein
MGETCCKPAKDPSYIDETDHSEVDDSEVDDIQYQEPTMSVVADTKRVVPYLNKTGGKWTPRRNKHKRDSVIMVAPYSRPKDARLSRSSSAILVRH